MYEVKDGPRTLQFEGKLLGHSTSKQYGSHRWIEFKLYKTDGGTFILSRVGVSLIYHGAACSLVSRYNLQDKSIDELEPGAVPCEECQPTLEVPVVFPEKYRYWALVTEDSEAVLDALYKYDHKNSKYLTKVAERLLQEASEEDSEIDAVYRVELIP